MLQGSQQCYFSWGFTLEQYCIFDYKSNNHIEKTYTANPLLSPHPPLKEASALPFFQGKKVNKPLLSIKPPPPLPLVFFTNK